MSNPITIEVNGQPVTGRYTVDGTKVTVSTINATKSARLGSMSVESLARMLLRELVDKGKGP
jgi:uncharacterized protein (DUF433 family)